MSVFLDRRDAGRRLADLLTERQFPYPLVLGVPRGGVIVAEEVAKALHAPLDTLVIRKVGTPLNPEFAVGAVAPHEINVLDQPSIDISGSSRAAVEGVVSKEREELRRRIEAYKSGTYSIGIIPKTVIIVDDGIATGLTARAAVEAAKKKYPKAKLIFAAPISLGSSYRKLTKFAEVLSVMKSNKLHALNQAYDDFEQVTDEEVNRILIEIKEMKK